MTRILTWINQMFDPLNDLWEDKATHRVVTGTLVMIFILSLAVIEITRQGFLPGLLAGRIPDNHYQAINIAFNLVLILEVTSLIFTLPCSMSQALGKQIEILTLIFLRNSFKELVLLPEPATVNHHIAVVYHILSYGGGAIIIFALLGMYTRMLQHLDETLKPGTALYNFVTAKKAVALLILFIFCAMGMYNGYLLASGQPVFHFFLHFYTVLIFSDVLLVLIAQCFLPEYRAVFRNSGYALATLLIRLALTAPVYYNVLIGIAAAVFAIVLTLVYNTYYRSRETTPEKVVQFKPFTNR